MKEFEVMTYGDPDAPVLLLQMVDDHDLSVIDEEARLIGELSGGKSFCLKAVKVKSWNDDLSPWPAPAVFGSEGFGGGAAETLDYLLREVIPEAAGSAAAEGSPEAGAKDAENAPAGQRIILGGYSLAGLFALWAGYRTDRFSGIAAASPSVWFPGFTDCMRENTMRAETVYLSLGDREERTRNPVMSQVGNAIRAGEEILKAQGVECVLEWNKGNHFKDAALRTAKAFAWVMKSGGAECSVKGSSDH